MRSRPRAGSACPGPPEAEMFAPHGIDPSADGRSLLVVNHGGREAVEIFAIEHAAGAPALRWVDCVVMPDDALMNDVAALPDPPGGFVVTQMTDGSTLGMLGLALGWSSGRVKGLDGSGLSTVPSGVTTSQPSA